LYAFDVSNEESVYDVVETKDGYMKDFEIDEDYAFFTVVGLIETAVYV
jgi:hypothetical protein